ncbi:MAG: aspartate 1-decarboxylase [Candidatus Omnitrophica bacterium]|nr:aspartate 1-decarboxylase [Candidatus Omnitrophota bacterium]
MFIECLKAKIANATVTEAELHYEGSITIDGKILKEANILEGEKVEVLNVNNGNRFFTYAISGKPGSGVVCLNGPAARLGVVGDKIIILNYALVEPKEAKKLKAKIIYLENKNALKS